jgi:LacI family repressor for deo operon, udp, cdd, tsx, nupC, and nupG
VLEAAEVIGYRFNVMAVDFRRGSARSIIVLVSDIKNPFFSEFFKGIEEHARSENYITLIGDTSGEARIEEGYVQMLASGKGDGLILNTSHYPASLNGRQTGLGPIVTCNVTDGANVATVTIDFAEGGRLAAEHLMGLGHTRIAEVCGPPDETAIAARHEGFRDALAKADIVPDEDLTMTGSLSIDYGIEAAGRLMEAKTRPTAVFVHNDETALGVVHALSKLKIRVPEDISVVGYDDMPFSVALSPALTTIRLPRLDWGRAACRRLIDTIEGRTSSFAVEKIIPELVIRDSTGPIAGRRRP